MKRRIIALMLALGCLSTPAAQAVQTVTAEDEAQTAAVSDSISVADSGGDAASDQDYVHPGNYKDMLRGDPVAVEAYEQIESALSGSSLNMSGSTISIEYTSSLSQVVGTSTSSAAVSSSRFRAMLSEAGHLSSIKDAFAAYRRDHPEAFYLSGNFSHTISQGTPVKQADGTYGCTIGKVSMELTTLFAGKSSLKSARTRFSSAVQAAATYADQGKSRYQKLRYLHDYLCQIAQYEYDTYSSSAYGALVTGNCMCEGYAQAFKLICDQLDIPCMEISGTSINNSQTESHMWNIVKMSNGQWYAVDVTWDDMDSDEIADHHTFFLVGSDTTASNYYNLGAFSSTHISSSYLYDDTTTRSYHYPELSRSRYWAATRMSLTESLELEAGESGELSAEVSADPSVSARPTISTMTAKSSDESVATVDIASGTVKAVSSGTATITVSHEDGISQQCEVTVRDVTAISLPSETALATNSSTTLKPTVKPAAITSPRLTWSSSDTDIVTVDENGTITGKKEGTATVTATSRSGKTASTRVTVAYVAAESVALDRNSADIAIGETMELTAKITPALVSNGDITWTSSNPAVASVDENGAVTGLASGTADITATVDGITSEKCTVKVSPVSVASVTLDKTSAVMVMNATESLTATVLPENATYRAVTWTSSNPNVASVDENGVVTANAQGSAVITAGTREGVTAECSITVIHRMGTPHLTGISNSNEGVSISWSSVKSATGYEVVRKDGDSWSSVSKLSSGQTTYTDKTVKNNTQYTYTVFPLYNGVRVKAYDENGLSIDYLTAPKLTRLKNARSGLRVSWGKVSGASGYTIYRKSSQDTDWSQLTYVMGEELTSYTDTTAKNGTDYSYTVQADSAKGSSGRDPEGLALRRVSSPSIKTLTKTGSSSATVKWRKVSYTSGCEVEYSTSQDFSKSCKRVTVKGSRAVSASLTKLKSGKTYYVRIRSYKTISGTRTYSAWSAKKSVKIAK